MDDTKIKEILKNKDPKELLSLFNFTLDDNDEVILLKFNLWSRHFFPNYHASVDALFHEEINENNMAVYRGKLDSFVNIAFRGAGKDVKTQLLIAFVILNDKKHFRRYFKCLSDDKMNSGQSVTDIYNMLVNPKIVSVYNDTFEKTVFKREERRDSFTTKSGIKVLADIVGTGQRGAKQEEARPDFIWFNDFETRKTLRSAVITRSIWDNMEEARTGLEYGGSCVYTCNYVSEVGNVHRLVTENLGKHKKVLIIPIMKNGVSTWERYTPEDIEAMRKADDDFEGERMCQPNASKDIYFDRAQLESMPVLQPVKEIAGFKMFKEYKAGHAYAGGHDVAGGVELDSSASVFIDFSTVPAQVVATFASNTIAPEAFGDEVYSQGNRYGGCLIAIENNKYDQAILKAKQLGAKLYMSATGKTTTTGYKMPTQYGWNTNSLTKTQMFSGLREAVEDGLISLNDKGLIQEAKSYTRNNIIDRDIDARLTTRHFDSLTACAIAWQMKDRAKPKKLPTYQLHDDKEVNRAI